MKEQQYFHNETFSQLGNVALPQEAKNSQN